MKSSVFVLGCSIVVLTACGPGKKLTSANEKILDLNSQISGLNTKISDDDKKLDQFGKQVTKLQSDNQLYYKEASDCRETKAAIARRLDNLSNALAEKGTSMKKITEKAEAALKAFEGAGAEVNYRNGLIHITMEDKLAFPIGSTKLSDNGRQIISVVADVLNDNPGVSVIIVGNTDTIKVSKGFADNWSLSTERANSVVRVLRDTYSINPARLTAAGRGKYNPIADNATIEGRAKNRRIEIIINPDLSRLWELSENP